MKDRAKLSRSVLILTIAGLLVSAVVILLWPRPMSVDLGTVHRADLMITIVEEGRTKVRETYIVSTPVAGRLLRVQLHPGDVVSSGETVVARMLPNSPTVLDRRTREQAAAAVEAATAAVRLAKANLNAAKADEELSQSELDRTLALFESEIVSKAALDLAVNTHRAESARRETAEAAVAIQEAELANAQASLISMDDIGLAHAIADANAHHTPIYSPIDGRVLQVFQESETILPAGAPIMEIGDVASDLEVVVELVSADAVVVSPGDRVIIREWGKSNDLAGVVTRVDPFGATKVSALGIEEQRVWVEIELLSPPAVRVGLGHGYRLEAAIVVWEQPDVLVVDSSALFRTEDSWSVFRNFGGKAEVVQIRIGENNGVHAQVLDGLDEGDSVVLYPSAAIVNGSSIVAREN